MNSRQLARIVIARYEDRKSVYNLGAETVNDMADLIKTGWIKARAAPSLRFYSPGHLEPIRDCDGILHTFYLSSGITRAATKLEMKMGEMAAVRCLSRVGVFAWRISDDTWVIANGWHTRYQSGCYSWVFRREGNLWRRLSMRNKEVERIVNSKIAMDSLGK